MIQSISVGELRRVLIEESNKEFKPKVYGDKETQKINREAYKSMKSDTSAYNGGLSTDRKNTSYSDSLSDNKGMGDLEYDGINDSYKKRVSSQMKGFASSDAENIHKHEDLGNGEYDTDGKIYNSAKDHAAKSKDAKDMASSIGLTARELDKNKIKNNGDTMYESKKVKRLNFKHTKFISEAHMLSKVPDEFKTEGNKFVMRDGYSNEYLVEWNEKEPIVTKKTNMRLVNEEKDRIKQLWGYKSPEANVSTPKTRINEDASYSSMIDKARKLMK